MRLEMDPEERRQLVALGRWRAEWQEKYGVDSEDDPGVTAEAADEFFQRADEIMGIVRPTRPDPDAPDPDA
jgi:hypothetical protein